MADSFPQIPTTDEGQQVGLPGEGVEHAPDGNAGEDTVVAPEAHVDRLKGRGHRQGCGTRCVVFGQFRVPAQRPPCGWCQVPRWPHSCHPPILLPPPIKGASTNGIWSLGTSNKKGAVVSNLCFEDFTQRYDYFQGGGGGQGVGILGLSPLLWPEQLHF